MGGGPFGTNTALAVVGTDVDYAMPGSTKAIEIIASKLDDSAGITGGAVLARKETK